VRNSISCVRKTHEGRGIPHTRLRRVLFLCAAAFLCGVFAASCEKQPTADTGGVRHFQLTGRVVSVDKANKSLDVDGDEIPGFMMAMEMPYSVQDPKLLDQVNAGDKIKADLVVSGGNSYLASIVVTAKGNGQPPAPPK